MPAQGGRYPVGAHDRPLRWRLSIGDERKRQGFFAQLFAWPPCPGFPRGSARFDDTQNEAIPAFQTDGLEGGGIDPRMSLEELESRPGALDVAVGRFGIDHLAVAHDVVENDHRAWM